MSLRNDNGSQFIAQAVRQYLKEKGILQEFSHVATSVHRPISSSNYWVQDLKSISDY